MCKLLFCGCLFFFKLFSFPPILCTACSFQCFPPGTVWGPFAWTGCLKLLSELLIHPEVLVSSWNLCLMSVLQVWSARVEARLWWSILTAHLQVAYSCENTGAGATLFDLPVLQFCLESKYSDPDALAVVCLEATKLVYTETWHGSYLGRELILENLRCT